MNIIQAKLAIETAIRDAVTELFEGVYLQSSEYMIEEQKDWPDNDSQKDFDFSAAKCWVITSEMDSPEPINTVEELEKFISYYA